MHTVRNMSMPDKAFEVNEPVVISETVDGETVIINLDRGTYYCLKFSGPAIWEGIQRAAPLPEIARMLRATFDAPDVDVESEISQLIGRLASEELIRPAQASTSSALDGSAANGVREAFRAPVLERFDDMEAMLLLDPIHDVDDEGWPHLPDQGQPVNE